MIHESEVVNLRVNIEAERARKRLTKEELSRKLGICLKTYYNWLNEDTDIPGTKLMEMATMFGVTMEYLMESVQTGKECEEDE